jgi:flavodoxin
MKKAIVVYYSKFGNTEKIARALAEGMKNGGFSVDCLSIDQVDPAKLVDYDVLALGAPTHAFRISVPMKDFLKKLEYVNLKDKKGFTFDTGIGTAPAGSAAAGIEKKLKQLHVTIIRPNASAKIKMVDGKTVLEEGAEKEFELIGAEIAAKIG